MFDGGRGRKNLKRKEWKTQYHSGRFEIFEIFSPLLPPRKSGNGSRDHYIYFSSHESQNNFSETTWTQITPIQFYSTIYHSLFFHWPNKNCLLFLLLKICFGTCQAISFKIHPSNEIPCLTLRFLSSNEILRASFLFQALHETSVPSKNHRNHF